MTALEKFLRKTIECALDEIESLHSEMESVMSDSRDIRRQIGKCQEGIASRDQTITKLKIALDAAMEKVNA